MQSPMVGGCWSSARPRPGAAAGPAPEVCRDGWKKYIISSERSLNTISAAGQTSAGSCTTA